MDLCKEKNEDALWMDEIAAMQAFSQPELPYIATSGIVLAGEDNDHIGKQIGSTDGSVPDTNPGMKYEHDSLILSSNNISICHPWHLFKLV